MLKFLLLFVCSFIAATVSSQINIPQNLDPVFLFDTKGQIWNVGEVVNLEGHKSLVLRSNDGQPGLVIMLNAIKPMKENGKDASSWQRKEGAAVEWGLIDSDDNHKIFAIGTRDTECGLNNMLSVLRRIESTFGYTIDDFHAFNACVSQGGGWYLPAINELLLFPKALGIDIPESYFLSSTTSKKQSDNLPPSSFGAILGNPPTQEKFKKMSKSEKKRAKQIVKEFFNSHGIKHYMRSIWSSTEQNKDDIYSMLDYIEPFVDQKRECYGACIMPVHLVKPVDSACK